VAIRELPEIPDNRIDRVADRVQVWSIPDKKWITRAPITAREMIERRVALLDAPEQAPPMPDPEGYKAPGVKMASTSMGSDKTKSESKK